MHSQSPWQFRFNSKGLCLFGWCRFMYGGILTNKGHIYIIFIGASYTPTDRPTDLPPCRPTFLFVVLSPTRINNNQGTFSGVRLHSIPPSRPTRLFPVDSVLFRVCMCVRYFAINAPTPGTAGRRHPPTFINKGKDKSNKTPAALPPSILPCSPPPLFTRGGRSCRAPTRGRPCAPAGAAAAGRARSPRT